MTFKCVQLISLIFLCFYLKPAPAGLLVFAHCWCPSAIKALALSIQQASSYLSRVIFFPSQTPAVSVQEDNLTPPPPLFILPNYPTQQNVPHPDVNVDTSQQQDSNRDGAGEGFILYVDK